jgi:hypothetical protein
VDIAAQWQNTPGSFIAKLGFASQIAHIKGHHGDIEAGTKRRSGNQQNDLKRYK